MKKSTMFLPLLLLSAAAAAPASAERVLMPVAAQDLNRFIGMEIHGAAHADLGVVSQADRRLGLIALAGKHGEFAVLHTSLLKRDGLQIYAPSLNVGHIAMISMDRMSRSGVVAVARTPEINIEEAPFVIEPYRDLPPD